MNIYDIAQRSGVSIATVSRVLNGGKNVSQKTREKVLSVMQEEAYTPNAFARGLGLNTMKMVGILCTDVSDTFYAKALSLVEGNLRRHGFDVLLCCTGSQMEDKKKYLELLLQKRVDAVVLIGSAFQENTDNSHIGAASKQVPVVIINGLVELPNVYCVLCDEKEALTRNVELLYRQGSRRILYLYDTLTYSGCQKLAGYREGWRSCGLPEEDLLAVQVNKNLEEVRSKVKSLLENGESFDAVLASEDLLAVGAQKALAGRGLTLPIIGFNNSVLAQCASPSLSSVDNMLDTLCPTAVNLLMDLLDGKPAPHKILLSAQLTERETFRMDSTPHV